METSVSGHRQLPPWPHFSEQLDSVIDNHHGDVSLDPSPSDVPSSSSSSTFDRYTDIVRMNSVLEYISDMLMDENMEDRTCMKHECTAYQATVSGFYQILGDGGVPLDAFDCAKQCKFAENGEEEEVEEDDYSWIDEVLVEEPSESRANDAASPWLDSSTASSDQDRKGDSYSSSPFSQDSPPGISEQSFGVMPAFSASLRTKNRDYMAALPPVTTNGAVFEASHLAFSHVHSYGGQWPSSNSSKSQDLLFFTRQALPENTHIGMPQSRALPEMTKIGTLQARALPEMTQIEKLEARDLSEKTQTKMRNSRASPEKTQIEMQLHAKEDNNVSFVNNKDLNAENLAKFYGDWSAADNLYLAKRKKKRQQESKGRKQSTLELVDLRALLVDCAQAIGANNMRKANDVVAELRIHASPYGRAVQRLAHYFTEALVARLSGTGMKLYSEISTNRPSAAHMLKAYKLLVEVCPFSSLAHCFCNKNILQVASGASRLHIVDFGILYGIQWPSLISALAERKEGPPCLRITGIDFPQAGDNPTERIEETGKRLAEYAKTYNVPFKYKAIGKKWEDIGPADLNLDKDEILVVNCVDRLRHLMDETVVTPCPRRKVLSTIRSLNPDIFVVAIMNAGFNAPFFVSRFREALYHFSSKFDMMETVVGDSESPQRMIIENACMGRDILNVVACEGPERIERPETHRQWHSRMQRAGFQAIPLDRVIISRAKQLISSFYHKDFSVDDDTKWMFLGWKGRVMEGLSAWRPAKSS